MPTGVRTASKREALVRKRRHRIAQAAFRLFSKKGYRATTMREVARACRMATGTLYHYIGAKSDILRILCLQAVEDEHSRLDAIFALAARSSAVEALREGIRVVITEYEDERDWAMFLNRQLFIFPRESKRMLLSSQVDALGGFRQILAKGVEEGEFQIDPSMIGLIAHNIVALGNEWVLKRWYLAEQFTLDEYIEKQTELILRQLRAGEELAVRAPAGRHAGDSGDC